jgi:hypothetical protein
MKMALSDLDYFCFKFKNLLFAQKNATLTLKSEAGIAQVTLCVDLAMFFLGLVLTFLMMPDMAHQDQVGVKDALKIVKRLL